MKITKSQLREIIKEEVLTELSIKDLISKGKKFFKTKNSDSFDRTTLDRLYSIANQFGGNLSGVIKDGDIVKFVVSRMNGNNTKYNYNMNTYKVSLGEGILKEWKAEEVLKQLGGNKFIAMTGAKQFVRDDKKRMMAFRIGKAKKSINYVRITLTSMDLYDVEFLSIRGGKFKVVAKEKGVYNDQLQSIFTKHTGLYTSL